MKRFLSAIAITLVFALLAACGGNPPPPPPPLVEPPPGPGFPVNSIGGGAYGLIPGPPRVPDLLRPTTEDDN